MCGIAGFCDFNKKSDYKILKDMTDILYHRGPDDSGYSFHNIKYCNIGLGHRRLSVLDLSINGHQPMKFENLEIVYNGEIYNFKEIRRELEKYGYKFKSHSDTEVVLKAYHKWGIKAVDKFNGMFAMSIFDKNKQKLFLCRDRLGVKPIFYYYDRGVFIFGSELKVFHKNPFFQKRINKSALKLYFQYGYIPEPYSIFENTYKLKAGCYLELDLQTFKKKITNYWNIEKFYTKQKIELSENEIIEKVENFLINSFEYRMVADVPIGLFLSGGYDSSTLLALLSKNYKLKTYTIGFEDNRFDEAKYAKKIANYFKTNHTEHYFTKKEFINIIPDIPFVYDEPFADTSMLPTMLVSKLAKKDVKVVLSADGGDELFVGYDKYDLCIKYYNFFKKYPDFLLKFLSIIMKILPYEFFEKLGYNFNTRYEKLYLILANKTKLCKVLSYIFTSKNIDKLFTRNNDNLKTNFDLYLDSFEDNLLLIDLKTYLVDDILHKVDRATMFYSLEAREPFLDYHLIEFLAQISFDIKYKNKEKKWLLKQITHKYIPKNIMEREKLGFGIPIEWLKNNIDEFIKIYLNKSRIEKEEIFNFNEIEKLLKYKNQNFKKIWFLLIFEMWYEKWM